MLPPTVPRLRTAGSAIALAASCRIGAASATTGELAQLVVGGERADAQDAAARFDPAQLGEPADVDQGGRLGRGAA